MQDILQALARPFPPDAVGWRVGSTNKEKSKGMAVCYIDARSVQRRLDEVMGFDWQSEIIVQSSGLVTCRIGLLINGHWRWRMDGTAAVREAPEGQELDLKEEQKREMNQKGAASDAFKRAAVQWGVARYLYEIPSPWVQINQYKQILDTEMPRLRDTLMKHAPRAPQPNVVQGPRPAPPQQQQSTPPQERVDPDTGEITGVDPVDLDMMRNNADFARIERLFAAATDVDELPVITADVKNKAAMDSWDVGMRDALREIYRTHLARIRKRAA